VFTFQNDYMTSSIAHKIKEWTSSLGSFSAITFIDCTYGNNILEKSCTPALLIFLYYITSLLDSPCHPFFDNFHSKNCTLSHEKCLIHQISWKIFKVLQNYILCAIFPLSFFLSSSSIIWHSWTFFIIFSIFFHVQKHSIFFDLKHTIIQILTNYAYK
jgi:hypothetical protein